jgi:hypothetical protein
MRFVNEAGTYYLEEQEQRVALTPEDLRLFKQMTPMGRKIALRQRAVKRMAADPADPEAQAIIRMFRLPAREWSFSVP